MDDNSNQNNKNNFRDRRKFNEQESPYVSFKKSFNTSERYFSTNDDSQQNMSTSNNFRNKRKFSVQESHHVPHKKSFNTSERYLTTSDDLQRNMSTSESPHAAHPNIKESTKYYENIFQILKEGSEPEPKDLFVSNALEESEGKEVDLCCHGISSLCIELLLNQCKDYSIMKRFMSAFGEKKTTVFTSSKASHVTEALIYHAVQAIQNSSVTASTDDCEENDFRMYSITWVTDFAEFALQNFSDCLSNGYSCHVMCTLVRALNGNNSKENKFRSKNSRITQEFHSSVHQMNALKKPEEQNSVLLEQIPKEFSNALKNLYKSLVKLENLLDYAKDSSSATIIEALLLALKTRLPKSCKKMLIKMSKNLFNEKDNDGVPICLLHTNCSYVVDEMFKAADEDLQLYLWNEYIKSSLDKLVIHSVGNFVIQRIYDVIKSKIHFQTICEATWCVFDEILRCRNFGIFVSMANACNRLNSQQPSFMKNIMQCLDCFEPVERHDLVIPLLLGFQSYDKYMESKKSSQTLMICLQGSLTTQAVLKFQKPLKAIKSMLTMPPSDLEFMAGHNQGCHALNAFFSSVSVGEKNKEKLLHHLKPVIVSIACNRSKSLTLCRIWILLSLKLREILVRELLENENTLRSNEKGNLIFKKFGIFQFQKHYNSWKEIQSNLTIHTK